MNNIQIFSNEQFGEVRTIEDNGKVMFCGKDVAKALGYQRTADAITAHCKGVCVLPTPSNGGIQKMKYITEGDLYRLITHSKLPAAEKFESWVFDEVMPTIRKTGGYVANDDLFLNTYLPNADEQTRIFFKAQLKVMENLNKKIEQDKPKVLFADSVAASHTSILIGELAKLIKQNGYDIGQKRLFDWLRNQGYLIRRKGSDWNMPTQKSMDLGLFEVKETAITHSDGHTSVSKTTKVTGKGQIYFINKFLALKDRVQS
ncbi:MAG: phage antirepressor [Bacillota bacterium]